MSGACISIHGHQSLFDLARQAELHQSGYEKKLLIDTFLRFSSSIESLLTFSSIFLISFHFQILIDFD